MLARARRAAALSLIHISGDRRALQRATSPSHLDGLSLTSARARQRARAAVHRAQEHERGDRGVPARGRSRRRDYRASRSARRTASSTPCTSSAPLLPEVIDARPYAIAHVHDRCVEVYLRVEFDKIDSTIEVRGWMTSGARSKAAEGGGGFRPCSTATRRRVRGVNGSIRLLSPDGSQRAMCNNDPEGHATVKLATLHKMQGDMVATRPRSRARRVHGGDSSADDPLTKTTALATSRAERIERTEQRRDALRRAAAAATCAPTRRRAGAARGARRSAPGARGPRARARRAFRQLVV